MLKSRQCTPSCAAPACATAYIIRLPHLVTCDPSFQKKKKHVTCLRHSQQLQAYGRSEQQIQTVRGLLHLALCFSFAETNISFWILLEKNATMIID